MNLFMSRVVIIYGQPGAGKGTEANLLAHLKGFYHFDTGQYLEEMVHDPKFQNDKIIQGEKKLWDLGKLCTPSWVLEIVKKKVEALDKAGLSVVFSGSPRTFFEAFGDEKTEGLISYLKKLFGRDNILIFLLKVHPDTTLHRNSNRLVCSLCGQPILYLPDCIMPYCPFCGGKLRKRILDNPEVIKTRLEEYRSRTSPIFAKLEEGEYKIHEIDAEPMPEIVFNSLVKFLE